MIFFLVIEFGLRSTGLQTVAPNPPKIYQTSRDPRISYELIPNIQEKAFRNIVTTDSLGFRTNGERGTKNQERGTIAMLGDSITFGYGVADSETLPAQIAALLPEYQVLNGAVPGYQLIQQTATYETKIAPLEPAALILVFFFNDFTSKTAWLDDTGILRDEGWVPAEQTCDPITTGILGYLPGKCWLDQHSAFYKAFKKLVNMRYMNEQLAEARVASQQNPEADDVTPEQLETYATQLDDLVVLLPADLPRLFVIWPDRKVRAVSRPVLRTIAEERGFTVVDLYDTFGNEVETLGWDTVHPSPQAIAKAAKIIAQEIKEEREK